MNAVNSPRQFLVIATAGHVDHGKTSLVRQLTGTDTDTLAEEKARGLTINTGFAYRHSGGESQRRQHSASSMYQGIVILLTTCSRA